MLRLQKTSILLDRQREQEQQQQQQQQKQSDSGGSSSSGSRSNDFSVGVITPYRAQLNLLRDKLRRYEDFVDCQTVVCTKSVPFFFCCCASRPCFLFSLIAFLSPHTQDGFQGQEKDFIIISCVRTGGETPSISCIVQHLPRY